MATGTELNEYIKAAWHEFLRDGTVEAVGREALKDVRSTLMQFFFGSREHGSEPGTPLTPLYYDLVQARKSHETATAPATQTLNPQKGSTMDDMQMMPSPSDVIANPGAYLPEPQGQQMSNAMAIEPVADVGMPSPSEVIASPEAYLPEPPVQEQHHDHSR